MYTIIDFIFYFSSFPKEFCFCNGSLFEYGNFVFFRKIPVCMEQCLSVEITVINIICRMVIQQIFVEDLLCSRCFSWVLGYNDEQNRDA